MQTINTPLKPGFVFVGVETLPEWNALPEGYRVSRRGGYGYFCRLDANDSNSGMSMVTASEYLNAK